MYVYSFIFLLTNLKVRISKTFAFDLGFGGRFTLYSGSVINLQKSEYNLLQPKPYVFTKTNLSIMHAIRIMNSTNT